MPKAKVSISMEQLLRRLKAFFGRAPVYQNQSTIMSSSAIVTFLYPKTSTSHFNMKYYLSNHIPHCKSLWEKLGMKAIYVVSIDGKDAEYATKTILVWNDMASWEEASSGPSMQRLAGDMKNFTDVTPVTVVGTVVG